MEKVYHVLMIPYFSWQTVMLGPIPLHVWGLFVALGAMAATLLARRAAKKRGLSPDHITDLVTHVLICAFIGARLAHVFFYNPSPFLDDPWEVFRVWHGGFASFGGFAGAAIAIALFIRKHGADTFVVMDTLAEAFPLGWAIGRVGCFLIHDHPGTLSHSFLTVQYPGGSRFDLGLIEVLTGLFVEVLLLLSLRFLPRRGVPSTVVIFSYLFIRFWTDFLRASDLPGSDVRYWPGLTPAQIGICLLLLLIGFVFFSAWKKGRVFMNRSK
jgi:phosphatidylglycerol:prolipoprotein diacylglycerol transferase